MREAPKRSVRQIIKVLELEGWAEPGVLKPSTMQRHLYDAGLGKKQMKRYAEKRAASSRRFCRPHRMELLQGDIKYGPELRTTDGASGTGMCGAWDKDCPCKARCVPVQGQNRKIPPESGTVYSRDTCGTCAFRGRTEPQVEVFLEQEYQKEAHAGFREYYESYGVSVPSCGITPEQEWMRDERGLVFLDVSVVAEAFLHRETRRIDEAGRFLRAY